ncbi:hypothetical protein GUG46_17580, partial [Xanthomonas citri pv. citri]|nr:hypothetical protein [Xanthomonas citri pv. citri]
MTPDSRIHVPEPFSNTPYQIQVEVDSEIDEYGLRTIAPPGTTRAWAVTVRERPQGMRITSTENGTLLSQA